MTRKRKGLLFLVIGCACLLIAVGWYVYNRVEDNTAGVRAERILQQFDREAIVGSEASVIVVEGEAFCGKLTVERLGLTLPIYDEWDYTRLKTAPCRYTGGADTNDLIIAAHNYNSHFGRFDTLQIGDEVVFWDAHGTAHTYRVGEIVTLDGTAVEDMQAGEWDLTLFTCTVSGRQRITVRCERI